MQSTNHFISLNLRPFLHDFLRKTSAMFELVAFTASVQAYADTVLDYLDPNKEYFKYRLYRHNCVFTQGLFIKDLRVLGNRRPEDIIIVDNAPHSFGFQLDNGVPIKTWTGDYSDDQLYSVVKYLERLNSAKDVRAVNRKTFGLQDFCDRHLDNLVQYRKVSKTK